MSLLILFSISLFLSSFLGNWRNGATTTQRFSLLQSFGFFGLMSMQISTDRHPSSASGKVLAYAWGVFTLITLSTYTANLAAFFSRSELSHPLCSIDDIVKSRFNASTFWFYENEFRVITNPIIQNLIASNRITFDLNQTNQVCDSLKSNKIVLGWGMPLGTLKSTCPDTYILRGYFTFNSNSFALRYDFDHAEQVMKLFRGYERSGFLHEALRKNQGNDDCSHSSQKANLEIGLSSFRELLLMMSGAAVASLLLEIVFCVKEKLGNRNSVRHL